MSNTFSTANFSISTASSWTHHKCINFVLNYFIANEILKYWKSSVKCEEKNLIADHILTNFSNIWPNYFSILLFILCEYNKCVGSWAGWFWWIWKSYWWKNIPFIKQSPDDSLYLLNLMFTRWLIETETTECVWWQCMGNVHQTIESNIIKNRVWKRVVYSWKTMAKSWAQFRISFIVR